MLGLQRDAVCRGNAQDRWGMFRFPRAGSRRVPAGDRRPWIVVVAGGSAAR